MTVEFKLDDIILRQIRKMYCLEIRESTRFFTPEKRGLIWHSKAEGWLENGIFINADHALNVTTER